jgi:3-dehydroquinate synthase
MRADASPPSARNRRQHVEVRLGGGDRDYSIHIGPGLLSGSGGDLASLLAGVAGPAQQRAVVITQPPIARHYEAALCESLRAGGLNVHAVRFPDGERHKTLATVERLYRALYELRADRKTLLVALGGGVVGDVAGFVAATYGRGLPYVQAPTTLLAMVDSSVGGKTGVDFAQGKNLIGAFHQPRAVVIDTDVLRTLSIRDVRAGLAEVVKYGAISDPDLLDLLATRGRTLLHRRSRSNGAAPDNDLVGQIVERSCRIKANVVAQDEREETGLRAILNFGHTVGHALEAATNYRRFRHGEAVAIGMVAAACIGEAAGITPADVRPVLVSCLRALDLPVTLPADVPVEAVLSLVSLDKKAEAGRVRWVLLRKMGQVAPACSLDEDVVRTGLALQARIAVTN